MGTIKDLFAKKAVVTNTVVEHEKIQSGVNDIPERQNTEFNSIGIDSYVSEKLQGVIRFDPKITVNQSCKIDGIGSEFSTTLNTVSNKLFVVDNKTKAIVADIPFLQLYGELLGSDPELDYQAYDSKQQKDYEAKYVAPTVEVIKQATAPSPKLASLFGKKPIEVKEEKQEEAFQATIEDLPVNMHLQAQESTDEGEVDTMPTQTTKRGRKPKLVANPPQTEESQPSKTTALLQDIASSSNSVIEQLKTLGNAIPSTPLPVSTNQQNDGVVDVKDISFDKFRPTAEFIEAISTIVTELTRYFNQAKQKE